MITNITLKEQAYTDFDDAERFAYFSKAIVEMLPHIGFYPDYIHANDWQTALVPVYLNLQFRYIEGYGNIKTIFTIHNIQYQGKYGLELMEDVLGIDKKETHILEFEKCVNFMKAAVEMSDRVTTVSPSYADEILNPWFSHGLDTFLVHRRFKLSGILNGIDVESYNPETDKMIFKNYSSKTLKDKAVNKTELLKQLSMEPIEGAPVIGIVSRLVAHKGMDLVKYVFEDMLKLGTQVVVLGSGEYGYEEFFRFMQDKHPDRVRFVAGFVPDLARKIYAGADIFLMPSKASPAVLRR